MVMPRLSWENFAGLAPRMSSEQRRAASVAGVAHALHDGYTDLIYILLPLWQNEFGLSYAALGALRSVFVGAMACLQIPAGFAADEYRLVGKLSGDPPFTGKLVHKGWKTDIVKLPRLVDARRLPAIAPAEVELV